MHSFNTNLHSAMELGLDILAYRVRHNKDFPRHATTDPSPISICVPKLIVYTLYNVLGKNNITSSTCRPD